MTGEIEIERVLKRDGLGRVELLRRGGTDERRIRRIADGGGLPGSGVLARVLLRREARALAALSGLPGVPELEPDPEWSRAPSADGAPPVAAATLVRAFTAGAALHQAEILPTNFFELLGELVRSVHVRGVCHNDLHKEQNVVVAKDGRPCLIDFQLASYHSPHAPTARAFRVRCRDDLRHIDKHHRRYTRDGRGPTPLGTAGAVAGPRRPRSSVAGVWRRTGKPFYNWVTRSLLGTRDGEERRDSSGPWPDWSPALGSADSGRSVEPGLSLGGHGDRAQAQSGSPAGE